MMEVLRIVKADDDVVDLNTLCFTQRIDMRLDVISSQVIRDVPIEQQTFRGDSWFH